MKLTEQAATSTFQIRACAKSEVDSWVRFLDRCFGYELPLTYGIDFAPLFEPAALPYSKLLWDGAEIAASATLHKVRARYNDQPESFLNLGIIGAVAVDEKHRGLGLSHRLLGELEAIARNEALDGLVLWTDKPEVYSSLGFTAFGQQSILSLKGLPTPREMARGEPLYGWDWTAVQQIYDQHRLRIERTHEHWMAIQKITSCTQVQWRAPNGEVSAYLGFDRGRDMHGIVHEWGGDPHALHCLLWVILKSRPGLKWLTHPLLNDPIREILRQASVPPGPLFEPPSPLGLFKPLRAGLASQSLDQLWFWGLDSN